MGKVARLLIFLSFLGGSIKVHTTTTKNRPKEKKGTREFIENVSVFHALPAASHESTKWTICVTDVFWPLICCAFFASSPALGIARDCRVCVIRHPSFGPLLDHHQHKHTHTHTREIVG